MNAPLRQPDWHRELIQAAIKELEVSYRQSPMACLALQISRNYRLLLTHQEQPHMKQLWRSRSRYWWQLYCQKKKVTTVPGSSGFYLEMN